MSQLQPLVLGAAAKECFLIKDDTLVQDGGTGPVLTDLASRQQVRCIWAVFTKASHVMNTSYAGLEIR